MIAITSLISISLRFFKSPSVAEEIWPLQSRPTRCTKDMRTEKRELSQPSADFFTDISQPSGPAKRQSDEWDTISLSSKQATFKPDECRPPSLLLPPAPTYSTLSWQPAYQLIPITVPAPPSSDAGAIYVNTEVDVSVNAKEDDDLLESETWVFADIRNSY